jgi:hypothetical protein
LCNPSVKSTFYLWVSNKGLLCAWPIGSPLDPLALFTTWPHVTCHYSKVKDQFGIQIRCMSCQKLQTFFIDKTLAMKEWNINACPHC